MQIYADCVNLGSHHCVGGAWRTFIAFNYTTKYGVENSTRDVP